MNAVLVYLDSQDRPPLSILLYHRGSLVYHSL